MPRQDVTVTMCWEHLNTCVVCSFVFTIYLSLVFVGIEVC